MEGTLLNYDLRSLQLGLQNLSTSISSRFGPSISRSLANSIRDKSFNISDGRATPVTEGVNKVTGRSTTLPQNQPTIQTTKAEELSNWVQKNKQEVYGTFNFKYKNAGGVLKVFNFSLLPAIESNLRVPNGSTAAVPEVKPGIMFKTVKNIKTYKIPGSEPVYQDLGVGQRVISLVGSFIGSESITSNSTVASNSGFLYDTKLFPKLTAYNTAALFDSEVVQSGRQVVLYLKTSSGKGDQDIEFESSCIVQSLRLFTVRSDRSYYAIDLIPTNLDLERKVPEDKAEAIKKDESKLEDLNTKAAALQKQMSDRRAYLFNKSPSLKSLVGTPQLNTELLKDNELQKLEKEYQAVNAELLREKTAINSSSTPVNSQKLQQQKRLSGQVEQSSQILKNPKTEIGPEKAKTERVLKDSSNKLDKLSRVTATNYYIASEPLPDNSKTLSFWKSSSNLSEFRPTVGTGPGIIAGLPEDWASSPNTTNLESAPLWDGTSLNRGYKTLSTEEKLDYPLESITTATVVPKEEYISSKNDLVTDSQGFTWYLDGTIESPTGIRYIPSVGVVRLDNKIAIPENKIQPNQKPIQFIASV